MPKKLWIGVMILVLGSLVVCWSTWVSNSTILNRVAIAEVKTELRTEIKGMNSTLAIHSGLLKEIRDDQKRRLP